MSKRFTVKRINPVLMGKILGSISAFIYLLFAMYTEALPMLGWGNGLFGLFGVVGGSMIHILVLIGCGLAGFISGVLMSLLYNLAVGFMGKVVDESEDDED